MARPFAAAAICLLLSGCGGLHYARDNYGAVQPVYFTAGDGQVWRIFDKPRERRLMITPSLGRSFGGGIVKSATMGILQPAGSPVMFRDAAQEYLDATRRRCTTRDTTLIVEPQYEVRYRC